MSASQYCLGADASKEKLEGAVDSLAWLVRACEIHGPLTHDGVVDPFHEFSQMFSGQGEADLDARLNRRENFTDKAGRSLLSITTVWSNDLDQPTRTHYSI